MQIELHQGRLSGVPPLPRILIFFVFIKEVSHLALDRFLTTVGEALVKGVYDVLLAFKRTMHKLNQID